MRTSGKILATPLNDRNECPLCNLQEFKRKPYNFDDLISKMFINTPSRIKTINYRAQGKLRFPTDSFNKSMGL